MQVIARNGSFALSVPGRMRVWAAMSFIFGLIRRARHAKTRAAAGRRPSCDDQAGTCRRIVPSLGKRKNEK
jgi:hypothetical protein